MALIRTVKPEEAEGFVAEVYAEYEKATGVIPRPLQMMTASPGMFENHMKTIGYFRSHPTLSFPLLTLIRFLVSPECGFNYCIDFNRNLLKRLGMEDDEVERVSANPDEAPLEDNEKALLLFVLKAVKSPETTNSEDIEALHELGWTDAEIYDATFHGARMVGMSIVFNAFQMFNE